MTTTDEEFGLLYDIYLELLRVRRDAYSWERLPEQIRRDVEDLIRHYAKRGLDDHGIPMHARGGRS